MPLSADLTRLVRQQFRTRYPKLCRLDENGTGLKAYAYSEHNIDIVKAYGSVQRWFIVRVHLAGAVDCGDTEAGFEIDDKLFVVDPQPFCPVPR